MPLDLLGPMVIFGISLTVLAVYFSGISTAAVLEDQDAARAEFLKDYADTEIKRTILTSDKKASFLVLSQKDAIGLVEAMGSQFLTRILAPGDVTNLNLSGGKLEVRFNDFTHNKQHYTIEDEKDAAIIIEALSTLTLEQGLRT